MAIFLIGMMGSGKSTVGKILADEMGLPFVDLDSFIENKENKTITEIFNQNGESYFRKLESEALAKSNSKKSCNCLWRRNHIIKIKSKTTPIGKSGLSQGHYINIGKAIGKSEKSSFTR